MDLKDFWQRLQKGVEVAVAGHTSDQLLGVRDGFLRFFHDGLDKTVSVAVVPVGGGGAGGAARLRRGGGAPCPQAGGGARGAPGRQLPLLPRERGRHLVALRRRQAAV